MKKETYLQAYNKLKSFLGKIQKYFKHVASNSVHGKKNNIYICVGFAQLISYKKNK